MPGTILGIWNIKMKTFIMETFRHTQKSKDHYNEPNQLFM